MFNADLSNANLVGSNFEMANLRSTSMPSANLSGATFNGANLAHSRLSRADLSGASLEETNLRSARVSGTVLTQANVKAANLVATGLSKKFALGEFPDLEFSNKTTWDTEQVKRHQVSRAQAASIEKEVNKRGFFSRLFSR